MTRIRPSKYKKDKVPIFINKLYQMLMDPKNYQTISWTDDGTAFVIKDLGQFNTRILPTYFRHCNYNSFVRQLNMYDFYKTRCTINNQEVDHVYKRPLFQKGQPQLLLQIKRKQTIAKCHSIIPYGEEEEEGEPDELSNSEESIFQKLKRMQEKQEKLQQFCIQLINQNQILINQNQELARKLKKQSMKKQRIIQQVFRIIGVSITQFWEQFCQDTETLQEKTNNFKQIYQILMSFIDQNDLPKILKTLQFFISPSEKKKKTKIFKVVKPQQQIGFLSDYTEEQVEQFINKTNQIFQSSLS